MIRRTALYVLLTLGLGVVITPFGWAVLSSFKPEQEIRRDPPTFWPAHATTASYRELFHRLDLFTRLPQQRGGGGDHRAGQPAVLLDGGYALTKLPFRARGAVFTLIMLQMMVPSIVLMIPQFVLVANLGLVNTVFGIVLPYLVMPLGIFLMRQFMADIPDELVHAARIDGAGEFRIFFRIVLPLCKPAAGDAQPDHVPDGLEQLPVARRSWRRPQDKYTLPVALAIFANQEATHYGLLLAGAVVVVTPVVILFLALQRFFVEGIASTGIK